MLILPGRDESPGHRVSGTGKSAALSALARRGYRVVDTDEPGWLLRKGCTRELDAGRPLGEVVSDLVQIAGLTV